MNYRVIAIWKNRKGDQLRDEEVGVYSSKEAAQFTVWNVMIGGVYVKDLDRKNFVHKKLFPNEMTVERTKDDITVSFGTVEKHIERNNIRDRVVSDLIEYEAVCACDDCESSKGYETVFYVVPQNFTKGETNGRRTYS